MNQDATRSLEELRRHYAEQNERWARAVEQLRALGDVTLAVPDEAIEAIDAAWARVRDREAALRWTRGARAPAFGTRA